jgi:hypothetical protein
MSKCLVTTLSEAVTDTSLLKLDEIRFGYSSSIVINFNLFKYSNSVPLTITLNGDIYFTDSTGTQNLGKTKTLSNYTEVSYISAGIGTITASPKSSIWTIAAINANYADFLEFDLSDITYLSNIRSIILYVAKKVTGKLKDVKNKDTIKRLCLTVSPVEGDVADLGSIASSAEYIYFSSCSKVHGNISAFTGNTTITNLWLDDTGVTGNLSSLADCTALSNLHLQNTAVTGDTSDLAGLTNLTTFIYTNTAITGTWPLT